MNKLLKVIELMEIINNYNFNCCRVNIKLTIERDDGELIIYRYDKDWREYISWIDITEFSSRDEFFDACIKCLNYWKVEALKIIESAVQESGLVNFNEVQS